MRKWTLGLVAVAVGALIVAACTSEKEVPVEVIKEVVVEKEVPVEKIIIKEVPVEKEVIKEVVMEKIVLATPEKVISSLATEQAKYGGTFQITSQGSHKSLDPYFAPAYVTTMASHHWLESPFAWDGAQTPRPQMIESWNASSDGKTWSFTLRDGLKFHDGSALTTKDVVASIGRWMAKQPAAKFLKEFLIEDGGVTADDERTYTFHFAESFGSAIDLQGATHRWLGIMKAEFATTPHTEDLGVDKYIGSASFRVKEWFVGDRIVFERFEDYVPRSEPGDFLAGAQNAYFDEVVIHEIPNEETKIAGLKTGEFDMVDGAALDFFPDLDADPDIIVPKYPFHQSTLIIHVGRPPTDNVLVRQSILAGINAEDYMGSLGPPALWKVCPALYYCGSPLELDVGKELYDQNDLPKAIALMKEAGAEGATFEIMNPVDYATIAPLGLVLKAQLEATGYQVNMPGMDWATLVSKLRTDEYNIFPSWGAHWAGGTPIFDNLAAGTTGYAGNFQNEDMKASRRAYALSTTKEEQFEWVAKLQVAYLDIVPYIYLGQFANIFPHRSYVKNMSIPAFPVFYNRWFEK
jgi:peptide/nickel transport system substrate-binding protein